MCLNVIASVMLYKNKLAIGVSGGLIQSHKEDMQFFKILTTNEPNTYVIMGRKTYESIPKRFSPLKNRINIVITNRKILWNYKGKAEINKVYFTSLQTFLNFYNDKMVCYIMGGESIYNYFLHKDCKHNVNNIYLTQLPLPKNVVPDTFIDAPDYRWKICGYTQNMECGGRILIYKRNNNRSQEYKYLDLMKDIIKKGNTRTDRTGTGTISVFGRQVRYDISHELLLTTTKQTPFKTILEELFWICRGDTNSKILSEKNIKIWDGNTSREFLDKQGLTHYPEGVLGKGYGWQMRHQGAPYSVAYSDTREFTREERYCIGGFDQLAHIEHLLKTDPFSRRILISYWVPADFAETALPPCHYSVQFYVEKDKHGILNLSCHYTMRSNDYALAGVYNLVFYQMLTLILAKKCGMKPKEIVYTCGDCHIYKNHIEAVLKQLCRTPRALPLVHINDSIVTKDWHEMTTDDFDLIGYFPYPVLKMSMSV